MSNVFCFVFWLGHAVSFASLGFISLYMAGKLGVFNEKGRGQSLRLLVSLLPLLIALTVALSRTCDYHHHWQGKKKTRPHFVFIVFCQQSSFFFLFRKKDVLCGSLLGLFTAYFCYRQHYPSLDSPDADVPLVVSNPALDTSNTASVLPFKTVWCWARPAKAFLASIFTRLYITHFLFWCLHTQEKSCKKHKTQYS